MDQLRSEDVVTLFYYFALLYFLDFNYLNVLFLNLVVVKDKPMTNNNKQGEDQLYISKITFCFNKNTKHFKICDDLLFHFFELVG